MKAGSATRFEEAYSASVSYNDVEPVLYSTEAPQQTAAVDVMCDGTEAIAVYDGSELPPKQLGELVSGDNSAGRIAGGRCVCVAITKEPPGDKPDFHFACGRFLSDSKSEELPHLCCKGTNAARVCSWLGQGKVCCCVY
jgi:hypothetical protein